MVSRIIKFLFLGSIDLQVPAAVETATFALG
jgi:hypothetical protein